MFSIKKSLIFVLFLILISLTGCSIPNVSDFAPGGKGGDVISRGFGLDIQFLPNQPPREIFVTPGYSDGVPVTVKIINSGPDSIEGTIKVYNTLTSEYGGIDDSLENIFYLDRAEVVNGKIQSVDQMINLGELSYNYDALVGRIRGEVGDTLVSEIDMDFQVMISVPLCLDDPTYSQNCPSIETLSGSKLSESVNAVPVTVKSVKKTLSPSGDSILVSLVIDISNVGNGMINNENQAISGFSVSLDGETLTCYATNKFSLKKGDVEVRCDTRRPVIYETPLLYINYYYPYKIKNSFPVTLIISDKDAVSGLS